MKKAKRKLDKNKIYAFIGRAVEIVFKKISIVILILPIIAYLSQGRIDLFLFLFGFLIGNFICFFISKFILCTINRMKKKQIINNEY